MNIVLTGYRGAGKTTIGKILAERLGFEYVSTDEEILKITGLKIPEFVERYGWEKFRDVETEVIISLSGEDRKIIDTGGGAILRESNVKALKKNGFVIFLSAPPDVLAKRIMDSQERPPLKKGKTHWEEVKEVLEERLPFYKKAMDVEVSTAEGKPEEICEKILSILREKGIINF